MTRLSLDVALSRFRLCLIFVQSCLSSKHSLYDNSLKRNADLEIPCFQCFSNTFHSFKAGRWDNLRPFCIRLAMWMFWSSIFLFLRCSNAKCPQVIPSWEYLVECVTMKTNVFQKQTVKLINHRKSKRMRKCTEVNKRERNVNECRREFHFGFTFWNHLLTAISQNINVQRLEPVIYCITVLCMSLWIRQRTASL